MNPGESLQKSKHSNTKTKREGKLATRFQKRCARANEATTEVPLRVNSENDGVERERERETALAGGTFRTLSRPKSL